MIDSTYAQKENNIWHFGSHAGIDFNTSPPTPVKGFYEVSEGSATYCDPKTGKLLISTNGMTVWDRNGTPMPNGSGLIGGNQTSTQAATIVPVPLSASKYYIFTCDQGGYEGPNQGVRFTVVDLLMNNGFGDVILKNIPLVDGGMTEKLTVIPNKNGCGLWIIVHSKLSNEYYSFLLQDSTVPVRMMTSALGHDPSTSKNPDRHATVGALVSNVQGTQLAYATGDGVIEVCDFDKGSGSVSNVNRLYEGLDYAYGVCFSEDGSKLYASFTDPGSVVQFDLSLPRTEISSSLTTLGLGKRFGALRPGPDGRIYAAVWRAFDLAVIRSPNAKGLACNFELEGFNLGSSSSEFGLPAVLDAYTGITLRPCPIPISFTSIVDTSCAGDCPVLTPLNPDGRQLTWRVSDGREFQDNDSVQICFDSPGTYTVDVFATDNAGDVTTASTSVTVSPNPRIALRSEIIQVDTIGTTVWVPITLEQPVSGSFEGTFTFDPIELNYQGSYDKDGNRIDVGQSANGIVRLETTLDQQTVVGYMEFKVDWTNQGCHEIGASNINLTSANAICISQLANYQICLDFCGAQFVLDRLGSKQSSIKVAFDSREKEILLSASINMDDARISIFDLNGVLQRALSVDLSEVEARRITIDGLASGMYIVETRWNGEAIRKPVQVLR
jgi:hypothetical protein